MNRHYYDGSGQGAGNRGDRSGDYVYGGGDGIQYGFYFKHGYGAGFGGGRSGWSSSDFLGVGIEVGELDGSGSSAGIGSGESCEDGDGFG